VLPDFSDFDFRDPDYVGVFKERARKLLLIRDGSINLDAVKEYYRQKPWQFITDWGMTFDPRLAGGADTLTTIPFILFPKQVDWVQWCLMRWSEGRPGITEKSREVGVSWLTVATIATLCIFHDGFVGGFGSRKEEYVDESGNTKTLFYKARMFVEMLPREFRGGWQRKADKHMLIRFPETGSTMTGEAGDNIGRGDRASIYVVDEAAYLAHPDSVDAALSQTTNCRIDVSSVNGMGNSFARKAKGGRISVFTFSWRDDPRKDEAWYQKQREDIDNDVIVAQELDIDYQASVDGVLIPSAWVNAAIDADKKIGFGASGAQFAALDVADQGADKCAFAGRKGVVLKHLEEWSGKDSDTLYTAHRAISICDDNGYKGFKYDADGIGAYIRGDIRGINEQRDKSSPIRATAFQGSGKVIGPEEEFVRGRTNADYFGNRKAQAWWELKTRFQKTFRMVNEPDKYKYDVSELIAIPSALPMREKLVMELSQPTAKPNGVGKIIIDKQPEGTRSPNLADAVMMVYAKESGALIISDEALEMSRRAAGFVGGRRGGRLPGSRANY
jgi:phage terminase large subunit